MCTIEMRKLRSEHKDALMAAGKWPDYVAFVAQHDREGCSQLECLKRGVLQFLGEDAARLYGRLPKLDRPSAPIEEAFNVLNSPESSLGDMGTPGEDFTDCGSDMLGSMPSAPAPVPLSAFDGKPECDEVENIRWVMENMLVRNVTAASCPSKTAWFLLCESRKDQDFRATFLKDYYAKTIVKPKEAGDGLDKTLDGTPTIDLIGRILDAKLFSETGLRDGAAVARGVHSAEAAGSNPAPATTVEAVA